LDNKPAANPGGSHTGYFRWGPNPFPKLDYKYVGYSLFGGGSAPKKALWGADDPRHWEVIRIFSGRQKQIVAGDPMLTLYVDPKLVFPVNEGGYATFSLGGSPSYGGQSRVHELYEVVFAGYSICAASHRRGMRGRSR